MRERAVGPAVARARLLDGPAAGEQAVLRIGAYAHSGPWPEVGDEVRVRGRVAPLGARDAYQRRRNAHAAVVAYRDDRDRRAARRRSRARSTPSGGAPSAGWHSGLAPPEAALLRGMVLGEDERLTDDERDGLPALRARAHPRGERLRT